MFCLAPGLINIRQQYIHCRKIKLFPGRIIEVLITLCKTAKILYPFVLTTPLNTISLQNLRRKQNHKTSGTSFNAPSTRVYPIASTLYTNHALFIDSIRLVVSTSNHHEPRTIVAYFYSYAAQYTRAINTEDALRAHSTSFVCGSQFRAFVCRFANGTHLIPPHPTVSEKELELFHAVARNAIEMEMCFGCESRRSSGGRIGCCLGSGYDYI